MLALGSADDFEKAAGQAASHAVTISPSRIGRASFRASIRARLMRCTQYVHFSMTPRERTVTSGFASIFSLGATSPRQARKLKRRTL